MEELLDIILRPASVLLPILPQFDCGDPRGLLGYSDHGHLVRVEQLFYYSSDIHSPRKQDGSGRIHNWGHSGVTTGDLAGKEGTWEIK